MKIPVSVIVVTKNEEKSILPCLNSLQGFDEIIVVDSASQDRTSQIAHDSGVPVIQFKWNGHYPKKRQWCLDQLPLKHDWVLFIDADERMTETLKHEISATVTSSTDAAGYFIQGRHVLNGKLLKHGLHNNKIALLNRRLMEFPIVDDLDIPGMGEIEGHYQPVLKNGFEEKPILRLKGPLLHLSMEDPRAWIFRHQKYARWERGMNEKNSWPKDPVSWREKLKSFLRKSRRRPQIIFFISYVLCLGFLDGKEGLTYARHKREYYRLISP